MPVPTARRMSVLVFVALFLAATLLGTRPSPRPTVLGRGLEWTVARTVRRTRFTAVALELSKSAHLDARAIEPDGSKGRRIAASPRPLSDSHARSDRGRRDSRETARRGPGSTRLRC